jgi:hypothetical protein
MSMLRFDPFSSELRANPYPAYAELRRHAPVYHVESSGIFMVSRYADVLFVLRHPELFSSSAMIGMLAGALGGAAPAAGSWRERSRRTSSPSKADGVLRLAPASQPPCGGALAGLTPTLDSPLCRRIRETKRPLDGASATRLRSRPLANTGYGIEGSAMASNPCQELLRPPAPAVPAVPSEKCLGG